MWIFKIVSKEYLVRLSQWGNSGWMVIFENPVRVENDFRGPIFLIFHFQISPPIWDMWWVKNFFKKTNSPIWSLEPSQNSSVGKGVDSHTKGSLPGWVPVLLWATFQPEKKTSTLNATSEILREKHLKIIGKAEIFGGMNSQILFEIENFVEISKSQDLLSFFKRWRCIHSAWWCKG